MNEKVFDKIREILEYELECIAEKGSIDHQSLDVIDKITHSLKSMDTIEAMEGGSSERGYYDGGTSGRRRNSMGRYTRDGGGSRDGGNSGYGGSSYRRYYRDDGITKHLEAALNEASDDETRQAIQRFMDEMK